MDDITEEQLEAAIEALQQMEIPKPGDSSAMKEFLKDKTVKGRFTISVVEYAELPNMPKVEVGAAEDIIPQPGECEALRSVARALFATVMLLTHGKNKPGEGDKVN